MLNAIASLFGYIMDFIYNIVQNYGLAIIGFTIIVKLLLLPFTIKQQKSLKNTQEIQPLIQELQRKYGNNQQKFAEEYQKLLKEKNMSMMSSMGCSGCLISLIQFPIVLGMFYMMASPLTHILKMNSEDIQKYKNQLNDIRMNQAIERIENSGDIYSGDLLTETIEKAKNATYVNNRYYELEIINEKELLGIDFKYDMNFLGINLCDIASANKDNKLLLIIPVLSTVFTYLSLFISTSLTKKKETKQQTSEDMDIPMPDMRLMNIMMPIMMGYVAYSVPQGVGLYWAFSNFLGVVQLVFMKVIFNKDEKVTVEKNVKSNVIKADYKVVKENDEKIKNINNKDNKNKSKSNINNSINNNDNSNSSNDDNDSNDDSSKDNNDTIINDNIVKNSNNTNKNNNHNGNHNSNKKKNKSKKKK